MDTVSMLNKMSFYCQPILPLVYDESMSYYETLCKVVGQLNTTGDTVNKLNEGLTSEIADRQKGDVLLDERLRVLEKTNKKIHFLTFAGTPPHNAKPIGTMPARSELWQWVNNNELIITLLHTTDGERNLGYAASCTYNAGNWASETSDDFNILVPIHTSYDADKDHAISQKVAKITIPPSSTSSLDGDWGLQFIEINTPSTSADGVVNFAANIFQDGHMECNLTPFEFMNLYAPTWANRNLCVAVNAKLFYDGYTRTSSIATLNSSNHIIRIAFERDYGTVIKNGVKQLNKTTDYIIGDVSYNTWTHESIDSKVFDFSRYEGFQFTRGAGNVITANDESTPNAVYAQYHSDTSGKLYQNLPVCLIDTVDNAEYWNGVFGIKDDKHMKFTFVTSNYTTAPGKMLVRVIELSADVNTTTWQYAEKEFTLPLTGGGSDFIIAGTLTETTGLTLDKTFDQIQEAIRGGKLPIIRLEAEGPTITLPMVSNTSRFIMFSGSYSADGQIMSTSVMLTNSGADYYSVTTPATNSNGTMKQISMDANPTMDMQIATKKYVDDHAGGGSSVTVDTVMSDTSTNAVQNKVIKKYVDDHGATNAVLYTAQELTFEQKQRARKNIGAAASEVPTITGGVSLCPANVTDSNTAVHTTTTTAGGDDFTLTLDGGPENAPVRVKGIRTPTGTENDAAANVEYVKNSISTALNNLNGNEVSY